MISLKKKIAALFSGTLRATEKCNLVPLYIREREKSLQPFFQLAPIHLRWIHKIYKPKDKYVFLILRLLTMAPHRFKNQIKYKMQQNSHRCTVIPLSSGYAFSKYCYLTSDDSLIMYYCCPLLSLTLTMTLSLVYIYQICDYAACVMFL